MLSNNLILIFLGAFYGLLTIIISIYLSKKIFNFLNKFSYRSEKESYLRLIAIVVTFLGFIGMIVAFGHISWKFPIAEDSRKMFSSSGLVVMWISLIFYFKKKRERMM